MRRHVSFMLVVMASVLPSGCRPMQPVAEIQAEPARFSHPEEVVQEDGFLVAADRRMFAAMAFLNAAGYDDELDAFAMHPVRVRVRREIGEKLAAEPRKLRTYRAYYREVIAGRISVFAYKDYVLNLSADHPFRQIQPAERLHYPATAETLRRLPDLLNEFWTTADLEQIWKRVKPNYVAEIHGYNVAKMKEQMTFLWGYLRMERRNQLTIVHIPDLLCKHMSTMAAEYRPYFYRVDSPGTYDGRLDRHEYLHKIVDPLVEAHYRRFDRKLAEYYVGALNTPAVDACRNPRAFAKECLVTALNRRISVKFEDDPAWTNVKEAQIAHDTIEGYTLLGPFYHLLAEYEQSAVPFDQFLPALLERLPEYGS